MEGLCRCCYEPCDLTRRESQYYYRFIEDMIAQYDENNEKHEEILKEFYVKMFNQGGDPLPEKLKSDEWKTIGF